MCSLGNLLDLKNEKHVVSLFFIRAGLSSSLLLPLSLSWSICPQGMDSSCSAWGPSLLPQVKQEGLSCAEQPTLTLTIMAMLPEPLHPRRNKEKLTDV